MTATEDNATEDNATEHNATEDNPADLALRTRTLGPASTCTVVICDDKPELRHSIAALLAHNPNFTVVGHAWDDITCLNRIREKQPDLLILDVNMPGGGPNVVIAAKNLHPHIYIVVFSGRHETHVEHAMRQAGADQYVLKTGRAKPLLQALNKAIA